VSRKASRRGEGGVKFRGIFIHRRIRGGSSPLGREEEQVLNRKNWREDLLVGDNQLLEQSRSRAEQQKGKKMFCRKIGEKKYWCRKLHQKRVREVKILSSVR